MPCHLATAVSPFNGPDILPAPGVSALALGAPLRGKSPTSCVNTRARKPFQRLKLRARRLVGCFACINFMRMSLPQPTFPWDDGRTGLKEMMRGSMFDIPTDDRFLPPDMTSTLPRYLRVDAWKPPNGPPCSGAVSLTGPEEVQYCLSSLLSCIGRCLRTSAARKSRDAT